MKQLLYIDLFCGAGGTSTGVNSARLDGEQCAEVIACVNHDANAIASHASNHPDALHFTEDIRTLELSPLVEHLESCRIKNPDALTVLWASLECTNFSKAKGGQPRDADSRTLAEHLFRYIEAIDPDYIQIENVEEFMSWGEVDENGKPFSTDKGRSYLRWVNNVKRYGYNTAEVEGHPVKLEDLARNDGLTPSEFAAWFIPVFDKAQETALTFAIIQFTTFRY